jgi:translation initiation factor 3 subunit D
MTTATTTTTTISSVTTKSSFAVPYVVPNASSWGPPVDTMSVVVTTVPSSSLATVPPIENENENSNSNSNQNSNTNVGCAKYTNLPYAPFGRSDRLGRVADFVNPHQFQYNQNRYNNNYNNNNNNNVNSNFSSNNENDHENPEDGGGADGADDNGTFQLVDTSKTTTSSSMMGGGGGLYNNNNNNSNNNKRFVNPAAKRRQHSIRLRQINARRQQSSGGTAIFPTTGLDHRMSHNHDHHGGGGRGGSSGGRGGGGRMGGGGGGRGGGQGGYYQHRVDRQPSVAVQPDWTLLEEIDLSKMTKHLTASTVVPKVKDVVWCGFLDPYHDVYDKVSARQPVPLKRMTQKEFYPVTTTDDPVLEKLALDGVGQIFITDVILAHLMTCTRSVYPWDIVIQKLPNHVLFFDKRDRSTLDYLTVQETAYIQPPSAPPNTMDGGNNNNNNSNSNNTNAELESFLINTPERLGLEATMINQNFSQQILKKSGRKEMDLPNPFYDEEEEDDDDDDAEAEVEKQQGGTTATTSHKKPSRPKMEPASTAFRYRTFELDAQTTVVCRTELHGLVKNTQYMTAFCLNEYTPSHGNSNNSSTTMGQSSSSSSPQQINWRDKIDSQRGAVLANELKNNSFKLAKWTAQSILAGADQMKIGFVSRTNPKQATEHVILATQFYRPTDFAQQITLQEGQMWCMFRTFMALILKQPEESGKYVLVRNPNKPLLQLYKVPPETFDDVE